MATVTISRQFASQGAEVARGLAQALGYHLVDRDTLQRLFHQYGMVEFDRVYDAPPGLVGRLVPRRTEVTGLLFTILRALARHGNCVIVGRCGYAALRGYDDVLNVRVQAPLALRARRAAAEHRVPAGEAAELTVRACDAQRIAFVESCGIRWDSTDDFDLVLDTGKVPAALAVSTLAEVVRALPIAPWRTGLLVTDLEIDEVMASAVADLLQCRTRHADSAAATVPERATT